MILYVVWSRRRYWIASFFSFIHTEDTDGSVRRNVGIILSFVAANFRKVKTRITKKNCAKTVWYNRTNVWTILNVIGWRYYYYYYYWYWALGPVWPETRVQSGDWYALVRCILCKFLGVACHCFPPLFRCSHFFTTRCLHVRHDVRDPSGGSGNCGRDIVRLFCRNDDFHAI